MPVKKPVAVKKKPIKRCNCVSKVNAQLAPKWLELDDEMVMSFATDSTDVRIESPIVALRWKDLNRKISTPPMFCAYCPFCGKKKS